jgi:tetratricopeptide (TPR) repeat protein
MRLLPTALWLILLQGAPAAAPAADPAEAGIKALQAEKYELAVQYLQQAVQADPKDYAAHFHLALANSLLGRDAEAIAGYRKVLELKPGLYEAELNLGMVLLRQKQAREAAPYLEQAAARKPKEFRPRLYLSDALFEAAEYAQAEESYKAALALDPNSAAAELGLARSQARQNRIDEASPRYRRAAELDPSLKGGLLELAELYEKAGRAAEAIPIYAQFPENVAVRERLGQLLVEAGRPEEAIPHLEWAVATSPTSANRLALAQAYRRAHQPEKELPVLEQAVAADPANLDLRMAYGRELRDQRKFAEAAQQFSRVAQAKPDSVPAWNELAAMLVSLENYPQALAVLDRIRALGGETAGHQYLRALVLDRTRDLKGALESYEKFLAASQGKNPNEEFKARQRVLGLRRELERR